MASRDLIRLRGLARSGDAAAQVELGRLYLSGSPNLAPSLPAALIWLERAARQRHQPAYALIGARIPVAVARAHPDPVFLLQCYWAAAAAGCETAWMTLAQWLLGSTPPPVEPREVARVAAWVRAAADRGDAAAAALLAQVREVGRPPCLDALDTSEVSTTHNEDSTSPQHIAAHDIAAMTVLARQPALSSEEANALLRYYHAHSSTTPCPSDAVHALHRAATAGLAAAQYYYGLWLGKFDDMGQRVPLVRSAGIPKVGPAVTWLRLAAEQEHGDAWFVLAMLHRNPRYTCHDHAQYLYCLHRAARLGCTRAQTYLGRKLWRSRRAGLHQWIEAAYWLSRAAQAGDQEALDVLPKAMGHAPTTTPWHAVLDYLDSHPRTRVSVAFGIRLRLAAAFGLNTAEMLGAAPRGGAHEHCLVVELPHDTHHMPRLIAIESRTQQQCACRFAALAQDPEHTHTSAEALQDELMTLLETAQRDGVPVDLPDAPRPRNIHTLSRAQ